MFAVITRSHHDVSRPRRSLHVQLQTQGIYKCGFTHRPHNAGGPQDRNAPCDPQPGIKGPFCQFLPCRNGDLHPEPLGVPRLPAYFLHLAKDHFPGHMIDGRLAYRLVQSGPGDPPYAHPAFDGDFAGFRLFHLGKNQGAMGGVRVISPVLPDRTGGPSASRRRL